jgi:hypothetical protein
MNKSNKLHTGVEEEKKKKRVAGLHKTKVSTKSTASALDTTSIASATVSNSRTTNQS